MVVGAQKSHSLLSSISWKPGKPGCSSQSKAKSLRSWGVADVSPWVQGPEKLEFQCWMAEEDGCPSSGRDREFTLSLPFCAIGALKGFNGALPHWWGQIFPTRSLIQLLILYRLHHFCLISCTDLIYKSHLFFAVTGPGIVCIIPSKLKS